MLRCTTTRQRLPRQPQPSPAAPAPPHRLPAVAHGVRWAAGAWGCLPVPVVQHPQPRGSDLSIACPVQLGNCEQRPTASRLQCSSCLVACTRSPVQPSAQRCPRCRCCHCRSARSLGASRRDRQNAAFQARSCHAPAATPPADAGGYEIPHAEARVAAHRHRGCAAPPRGLACPSAPRRMPAGIGCAVALWSSLQRTVAPKQADVAPPTLMASSTRPRRSSAAPRFVCRA